MGVFFFKIDLLEDFDLLGLNFTNFFGNFDSVEGFLPFILLYLFFLFEEAIIVS